MKTPIYKRLYFQVLVGIVIGAFLGHFFPEQAVKLKPLGDAFIRLIKMMVAPIIFCTIVVGIAKMGDMREVGRVGLKALVYFEVVSTLALIIGLIVVNIYKPGAGMNVDPASLDPSLVAQQTHVRSLSTMEFLLNIIPHTVVDAFAKGEILQVLLFSVLFGVSLSQFGEKGRLFIKLIDQASHVLFGVIGIVMRVASIGAMGAMAFSIGKFGLESVHSQAKLMLSVLVTCILFITFVLGPIMKLTTGFSLWKFLKYIKEEIFIVLGTSSSETALPRMITKLENLGCAKPVVGLVIPTGYSFNLDGTSIYLTMASVFIAQATNTDLSLYQQLSLLGVLMLTSKGAAAVPGGGFVTLASTLASIDTLPVAGLTLLLGVDIFMSQIRSATNLIGNGVATVVVSQWEKALDIEKANHVLTQETVQEADEPEVVNDEEMEEEIPIEKNNRLMD